MTEILNSSISGRFTDASEFTGGNATREFADIIIPVPWGHISGKWYGPQNVRPILGLHGWLDNAGTFDRLVPLLSPNVAFLSIDLPGHGLSSHLPHGCNYNISDNLVVIRMIMHQYRWKKVSLMGHSLSAIIVCIFAAAFPDKTDMIISIDAPNPHLQSMEKIIDSKARRLEEFLKEDDRDSNDIEPLSYAYDELIEGLFNDSLQSVKKDHCKYILARNIQKSEKYPDKYFFCRDPRIRYYSYIVGSNELPMVMAKRITAAHMLIRARNSSYSKDEKYYNELVAVLKQRKNFEYVEAEGTHYLHLNNPEDISDDVNRFIERYGPKVKETSKL